MAKTGPQRYPGASTAYWYQSKLGGDSMESNVIVWHTTEGTMLPSYSGGTEAPNFTAKPDFAAKVLRWYQHFDFDTSSRALVHAGAVATNTLNVAQVELVATCDPATHAKWTKAGYAHLYTPELPDWVIRDLAAFAKWAHDQHGVPLTSGVTFKAYPGSYGIGNGVRMSNAEWLAFKGHCGHQHVPSGNLHGDPGAFPMTAILTAAKGGTTPSKETDVALSAADVKKLLTTDGILKAPADATDVKTNPYWTLASHIQATTAGVRALQKSQAAQTAALTALAKLVGSGVDTAAVVAAVEAAIENAVIDVNINSKDA
jgi:hypothetical protein